MATLRESVPASARRRTVNCRSRKKCVVRCLAGEHGRACLLARLPLALSARAREREATARATRGAATTPTGRHTRINTDNKRSVRAYARALRGRAGLRGQIRVSMTRLRSRTVHSRFARCCARDRRDSLHGVTAWPWRLPRYLSNVGVALERQSLRRPSSLSRHPQLPNPQSQTAGDFAHRDRTFEQHGAMVAVAAAPAAEPAAPEANGASQDGDAAVVGFALTNKKVCLGCRRCLCPGLPMPRQAAHGRFSFGPLTVPHGGVQPALGDLTTSTASVWSELGGNHSA